MKNVPEGQIPKSDIRLVARGAFAAADLFEGGFVAIRIDLLEQIRIARKVMSVVRRKNEVIQIGSRRSIGTGCHSAGRKRLAMQFDLLDGRNLFNDNRAPIHRRRTLEHITADSIAIKTGSLIRIVSATGTERG